MPTSLQTRATRKLIDPILDVDPKTGEYFESPIVFKGFVKPAPNKTSVMHGAKTLNRSGKGSKCALPGELIELTAVEIRKLIKKGIAAELLCKTLPTTVGGEGITEDDWGEYLGGDENGVDQDRSFADELELDDEVLKMDGYPDVDSRTNKPVLQTILVKAEVPFDATDTRPELFKKVSEFYATLKEEE